jgi:hypothetical protein
MQYIKHYYVDEDTNAFCCETTSPAKYKIHPWAQYEGLDVKVWLTDSDGVEVMLAELPDSTPVSTITEDCGKNSIQVLTEVEYNSVFVPYSEAQTLYLQARKFGDPTLAEQKRLEAEIKMQEAEVAIRALE